MLQQQYCGVKQGSRRPDTVTKTNIEQCHSLPWDNSAAFMDSASDVSIVDSLVVAGKKSKVSI